MLTTRLLIKKKKQGSRKRNHNLIYAIDQEKKLNLDLTFIFFYKFPPQTRVGNMSEFGHMSAIGVRKYPF